MGMTVKKSSDSLTPTVWLSGKGKIADVPMGASVSVTALVDGSVLLDGSVLNAASSGVRTVAKYAKCLTGTTTTSVKVATLGNQFKVGDLVTCKLLGKAYAITVIASASGVDTMTIGTAIDAPLSNGSFIYEAAAEAASNTSALKDTAPEAITGTNVLVDSASNLTVDAWVIATVKAGMIGPLLLDALVANQKLIVEI
jgi:hypothetical protein